MGRNRSRIDAERGFWFSMGFPTLLCFRATQRLLFRVLDPFKGSGLPSRARSALVSVETFGKGVPLKIELKNPCGVVGHANGILS